MTPALPLLLAVLALGAPPPPVPPPGPREGCPVCGMLVARFPDWTAAVQLADGSFRYFDGAKDLFTFLRAPGRPEPRAVWVKDYYRLRFVDARTAVFVLGSDVHGPMGHELVPFATEAAARGFLKDHKGQRIVRFAEVTPALLAALP